MQTFDWPIPIYGFEGGYGTEGDTLVNVSADGVDLNTIWKEVNAAVDAWNAERGALASLLSYATVNTADPILQSANESSFEVASEFGEPEAHLPGKPLLMGYTFEDYDFRIAWTWRFLRNASKEQIIAVANNALEADNKLINGTILDRLFNPAPDVNDYGAMVYGLYNGDSIVPPPYLGRAFPSAHQHYLVSGNDTVDSGDIETLIKKVAEHGFNTAGAQLLLLVNPEQGEVISSFKAGEANNNGQIARHDYIPSAGAPAYLQTGNLVGKVAPEEFNGLRVSASYGPTWVVESDYVPAGYIAVVSTYGPNSPANCIGVRQHVQVAYQGLRIIPGQQPSYPLQQSFFARGFGVGVRRRGQAAVMQIKAAGSYDTPQIAK